MKSSTWPEWLRTVIVILGALLIMILVFAILLTAFAYALTPFGEPKFWWEY